VLRGGGSGSVHVVKIIARALFSALGAVPASAEPTLVGSAAYGDWHADAPGVVRHILPDVMPSPYATSFGGPITVHRRAGDGRLVARAARVCRRTVCCGTGPAAHIACCAKR